MNNQQVRTALITCIDAMTPANNAEEIAAVEQAKRALEVIPSEAREARDYTGKLCPMPTPSQLGAHPYTRRATYDDGLVELWAKYTSSGTMYAVVYGLQIEHGLDYSRATRRIGEALLHAANCDGKLN